MISARTTLRRMAMALAVAYLLVLQALLGGMSSGAHAGSMAGLDSFGQTLCLGAHDATPAPTDPAHHTPDCCTTGCQTSFGTALPALSGSSLALPVATAQAEPAQPLVPVVSHGVDRSPRQTRAPPLA